MRWGYELAPVAGDPARTELTETWEFLPPEGLAMFADKYGDDADAQVADRAAQAHAGIPATLAALARVAAAERAPPPPRPTGRVVPHERVVGGPHEQQLRGDYRRGGRRWHRHHVGDDDGAMPTSSCAARAWPSSSSPASAASTGWALISTPNARAGTSRSAVRSSA